MTRKMLADVDDIKVWREMHQSLVAAMISGDGGGGCTIEEAYALLTAWANALVEVES
jgi:hypothetical protein